MRGVTAAVALLALVLSGCSGSAGGPDGEPEASATFDDYELDATDTTGVVRGLVVDDRIVPIEGAEVTLRVAGEEDRATTTDAEGRFAYDDVAPGTHFLSVTHLLHQSAQSTVEVLAGVDEPPITKVLLPRLFEQEPFTEELKHDGFIQCNQAGVVYATAPCITDFSGLASSRIPEAQRPCVPGVVCCNAAGCFPELRRIQEENRGFTTAVGAGWQALVFEMQWEETSETFDTMGITVSYNETARCACHNFASYGSTSPLRMQIDVGTDFQPSNDEEPNLIPPEGIPDLYYFVGVRSSSLVPAVAVNQDFQVFVHFFYYGIPPEGWSFIEGDTVPF